MADLFPKFLIVGDRLIIGKVSFHKQLTDIRENIKGGGWFTYISETDTFVLYNTSSDFGTAKMEDIEVAVKLGHCDAPHSKGRYNRHNFGYYNTMHKDIALQNFKLINK